MSTPTHVSDGLGLLPCRTASQANRSTCAATSPPSQTVPVTHLATSPPTTTAARSPLSKIVAPSQIVVMRWLHICRSTKSRRVLWSPRTLPVADERASFRHPLVQTAAGFEAGLVCPGVGLPRVLPGLPGTLGGRLVTWPSRKHGFRARRPQATSHLPWQVQTMQR